MKICRQAYVVVLGYIACCSAADPIITTTSSLNGYGVFENSSEVTLICTIQPYTNIMRWKINSSLAADCLATICDSYIAGRYTFAFDTGNGMFNLTINVVTFDDNGITFECYDGSITTELTAIVKEKKMPTDQIVMGIGGWCIVEDGEKWCHVIIGLSIGVCFLQVVLVATQLKQKENQRKLTVEAMEKERDTERIKLETELENRDKEWRDGVAKIETESHSKILEEKQKLKNLREKVEEGNNNMSRPGERKWERNLRQNEKLEYYRIKRTILEFQRDCRLDIQSEAENELIRRKDEITKRYQQRRSLFTKVEKERKLNKMHEKVEMQMNTLQTREIRTELAEIEDMYRAKIEEEERKLQQTTEETELGFMLSSFLIQDDYHRQENPERDAIGKGVAFLRPVCQAIRREDFESDQSEIISVEVPHVSSKESGNQPNHKYKELTIENLEKMLKEKRKELFTKRENIEDSYRDLRENIEKMYSDNIKEEEEKLKQLGKTERTENHGLTDRETSTVKDIENTLNEDERLEYYKIKRKVMDIKRHSRELVLTLEIAELEDAFGLGKDKLNICLGSQRESKREEQRRNRDYKIVNLRKKMDKIEERHETKMKEKEEYLEQQNSGSYKRCLNKCWLIVWFVPVIGLLVLGLSMLVHCCKKCPQNKVDDSPSYQF